MKKIIYLFLLLLTFGCTNSKGVYWCGDHPCINKKEKIAYFKKTMIVEIKNPKNFKSDSESEKIINQAKINEKKRIIQELSLKKREKIEKKNQIKKDKEILKRMKKKEKKRIKEEKKIAKQNKKLNKKTKIVKIELPDKKQEISSQKFSELAEMIVKKSDSKPFPNINDIDE